MLSPVELALGTAQFGLKYGIAGRGEPVPSGEVRSILSSAWERGIRVIDAAPAYGDIEGRLDDLAQHHPFAIVSKIPALPQQGAPADISSFVGQSIGRTRSRLRERLHAVLFHRGEDLLGSQGDVAWQSATEAIAGTEIRLGASCYSPDEAAVVRSRYPIAIAQIPGNAFDQRLAESGGMDRCEVHLRSAFLQGLLLMSSSDVSIRMPWAAAAIAAWHHWCADHGLTPLQAALSIAKGLPAVRYCIVGVDRQSQLEEIAAAWQHAEPLRAPQLAMQDRDIIDPRRW